MGPHVELGHLKGPLDQAHFLAHRALATPRPPVVLRSTAMVRRRQGSRGPLVLGLCAIGSASLSGSGGLPRFGPGSVLTLPPEVIPHNHPNGCHVIPTLQENPAARPLPPACSLASPRLLEAVYAPAPETSYLNGPQLGRSPALWPWPEPECGPPAVKVLQRPCDFQRQPRILQPEVHTSICPM